MYLPIYLSIYPSIYSSIHLSYLSSLCYLFSLFSYLVEHVSFERIMNPKLGPGR